MIDGPEGGPEGIGPESGEIPNPGQEWGRTVDSLPPAAQAVEGQMSGLEDKARGYIQAFLIDGQPHRNEGDLAAQSFSLLNLIDHHTNQALDHRTTNPEQHLEYVVAQRIAADFVPQDSPVETESMGEITSKQIINPDPLYRGKYIAERDRRPTRIKGLFEDRIYFKNDRGERSLVKINFSTAPR